MPLRVEGKRIIVHYIYLYWCVVFLFFRLKSYVRKTRTIQIDSERVTYIAADKEVKIYADNSSNGTKRNMKNVSIQNSPKISLTNSPSFI